MNFRNFFLATLWPGASEHWPAALWRNSLRRGIPLQTSEASGSASPRDAVRLDVAVACSERAPSHCLSNCVQGPARVNFAMHPRTMLLIALPTVLSGCGLFGPDPTDGFWVPDGFEISIAAAAPLVERPMIIAPDDQGYLYVAESSGSNDDVRKQLEERPHSILRLEDVDGDGVYDRRTVFADRMMFPEGVLWHDGSVYVAAPPSIWKLTDTDGDGVADEREEWFDAKTLTNCANDLHGPYLGLDGWIYWTKGAFAEQTYERPGRDPFVTRAAHVFRRRASGGPVEPVLTGGMDNPVEVAFTPEGERLLTSTFLIHPQVGRRDGMVHAVYGGVYGKVHGVTDSHPMTGGYLSVMTEMGAAAPVGLARYETGTFGEDYRGRLFATAFNLRKVSSHKLVADGATFRTEDADFLVSDSRDFHPTDVMEDSDGSLLVVDTGGWYKLCCPTSQLSKPDVLGAIYRVRKKGAAPPADPLGAQLAWSDLGADGLVGLLGDRRPAVVRRAIAALASEGSVQALRGALAGKGSADLRRNAVWALTRIDTEEARTAVRAALRDDSPSVRQAALHSVALHRDAAAVDAATDLLADPSDAIKRVAAEALGRIGDPSAVPPLLDAAGSGGDEILTHSLVYALIEIGDPGRTRAGLSAESGRTRRAALIALDQMQPSALGVESVISRLDSPDELVSEASNWIASRHPEWGDRLAGHLRGRLRSSQAGEGRELADQLVRYSASPEVQKLLAATAARSGPVAARLTALRAIAAAPLDEAPEGWAAAIVSALKRADTREAALLAARQLPRPDSGLPELDSALLDLARDESARPDIRIRALDAAAGSLMELEPELFRLAASQVSPANEVSARAAAARVLSTIPLDREQLLALADLLPDVGPMELPQLVAAFGRSQDSEVGARFADALSRASGLANLRADIALAAAAGFAAEIGGRVDSLLEGSVAGLESQAAELESILGSLPQGDIVRGQAVFNRSDTACLACHSIGYGGGKIGPDLTRIGQIRERRDLLEAILYPSASFVRSYEPVVVVTAEESLNGLVLEETDTHLRLAMDADNQARIARSDVEEVRPGTVSIMPLGMADQITRQELADLLAFLEATQWGPRRGPS